MSKRRDDNARVISVSAMTALIAERCGYCSESRTG